MLLSTEDVFLNCCFLLKTEFLKSCSFTEGSIFKTTLLSTEDNNPESTAEIAKDSILEGTLLSIEDNIPA